MAPVMQADDCADVAARRDSVVECADGWRANGRRTWCPAKEPATGHSTVCCAAACRCARAMATARHWGNPLQITRRSRQAPDAIRHWPRRCGIRTGAGLLYASETNRHPGVGSRRSFTHPRPLDGPDQANRLDRYLLAASTQQFEMNEELSRCAKAPHSQPMHTYSDVFGVRRTYIIPIGHFVSHENVINRYLWAGGQWQRPKPHRRS